MEVLVACGRAGVLRWAGDEEEKWQHACAEDGQVLDDVEVGEHGGLAVKLVVDVGLGCVRAGSGKRIASAVATEHALELCYLIDEGGVSRGQVADHVGLVRGGAASKHSRHERRSAGAADVAGKIG